MRFMLERKEEINTDDRFACSLINIELGEPGESSGRLSAILLSLITYSIISFEAQNIRINSN